MGGMSTMDRRTLLSAAFAGVVLPKVARSAGADGATGLAIVDTQVSLFHWPFRRLPHDEPEQLVRKLKSLGVREAWAGSFEGLLHRDLAAVNGRLAEACAEHGPGFLRAMGCVNPLLPDWELDLRRCAEVHRMRGIRLHPNYHGYTLAHPAFERLLARAGEAGLIVQLAVSMEDTRTQHPLTQVADVDLKPLADLLRRQARTKVMLLNHRPVPAITAPLAALPNVFFDLARTEATDGVAKLVALAGREKVMFGSHAPFLIPEAALIRVEEGVLAGLGEADIAAVLGENAARLAVG
jgi:predicted TIM-barrel fold metal-dependent hydrolase